MKSSRSPAISAGASSALPRITSPVLPLREIQSFSATVTPPSVNVRASSFTCAAVSRSYLIINIHTTALNIHTMALNIHTIALNIHTPAR
eukprot:933053-Prorocentrum_minimum.AAC.2